MEIGEDLKGNRMKKVLEFSWVDFCGLIIMEFILLKDYRNF